MGSMSPLRVFGLLSVSAAWPNPSIERTSLSQLRWPKAAAHVERWAPFGGR